MFGAFRTKDGASISYPFGDRRSVVKPRAIDILTEKVVELYDEFRTEWEQEFRIFLAGAYCFHRTVRVDVLTESKLWWNCRTRAGARISYLLVTGVFVALVPDLRTCQRKWEYIAGE